MGLPVGRHRPAARIITMIDKMQISYWLGALILGSELLTMSRIRVARQADGEKHGEESLISHPHENYKLCCVSSCPGFHPEHRTTDRIDRATVET